MIKGIVDMVKEAAVKKPLVIRDDQKFLPTIRLSRLTTFQDADKFWRQWQVYATETLRDESE